MLSPAHAPSPAPAARRPGPANPRRLLRRWWREQSPSRQDRFVTLGPLVSVMLFMAAMLVAFWYLRNEEQDRQRESVKRDTEVVQQQIRLRLTENQEQLQRLAREVATRPDDAGRFLEAATAFVQTRPEIVSLSWAQADRRIKASQLSHSVPLDAVGLDLPLAADVASEANSRALLADHQASSAFSAAREQRQPIYSQPLVNPALDTEVIQIHVPLIDRKGFAGTLVAEYSVDAILRYMVPREIASRHAMSLVDYRGKVLSSTVAAANSPQSTLVHEVIVTPIGNGLILRGQGYRTSVGVIGNTLFWMVIGLSALTVWMLLGTWRHMNRRLQIQKTLMSEMNFRRAMENSMLTGMRVIDNEGRITYVNPAFCAMTGFTEAELLGRMPPYPYWPLDRMEENNRLFQQELQGRSPAGGVEVRIMRKDGSQFDARMYVSPLIDARGRQTGWMSSVTNITEAKRVRDQLSAAHERFTTVLEGLDAAVSVLGVQRGELLFANRSYRLWFGTDPAGHAQLAGEVHAPATPDHDDPVDNFGGLPTQQLTEAGSDTHEVHIESLQKWFDVRTRYIQWTDGRLAQMLIATDITARRRAEEVAAQQAEKAQVTSRLITMGEMASSVAHELNQPLTAISNYCTGMVSRVRRKSINEDDLIAALEKTARQAQRAGQVIHRIRAFVKRSEPQRQPSRIKDIVEDAVELASIELRRRKVLIHSYVAPRLPLLMVDPILIEQVLLNLLKNAAEAIDGAKLPTSRRRIELRVVPKQDDGGADVVEFSVADGGPGLKQEVIDRAYEAFFSTKSDGMGIGLNLCRSIIESHQGRIHVENLYNGPDVVGCRFWFTLPVEPVADEVPTGFSESKSDPPLDLIADNP